MQFDEITLTSHNAIHKFFINGKCNFAHVGLKKVQVIECHLDQPIFLREKLSSIEVNGIVFECLEIQIENNKVIGQIEEISSLLYTKNIKAS